MSHHDIRIHVSEGDQQHYFQNSTLQSSDDLRYSFSVATFINGIPSAESQEQFAEELALILDRMAEAAKPAEISFEVEVGACRSYLQSYGKIT